MKLKVQKNFFLFSVAISSEDRMPLMLIKIIAAAYDSWACCINIVPEVVV